jgi:far upstream element-binding protein
VRIANLSGSASQVSAARAAIKVLIENNMASKGSGRRDGHGGSGGSGSSNRGKDAVLPPGTNKLTFSVPDKCVGLIIGRGGESINEIQRRSGARVNIVPESQSVNGRRPVNLFGSDEANERARELIEVIVRQDELGIKKGQPSNTEAPQRPNSVILV